MTDGEVCGILVATIGVRSEFLGVLVTVAIEMLGEGEEHPTPSRTSSKQALVAEKR
jgi:hypothetical protein